jgi:hypothetical protein
MSDLKNKFIIGSLEDREQGYRKFVSEMVGIIRSHKQDMDGVVREVWRVNSTDFHIYDGESLARLRKAFAVWVDLGAEEDSPGMNAFIQVLLRRRYNPKQYTVLAARAVNLWVNATKFKDAIVKDVLEAFDAA